MSVFGISDNYQKDYNQCIGLSGNDWSSNLSLGVWDSTITWSSNDIINITIDVDQNYILFNNYTKSLSATFKPNESEFFNNRDY